MLILPHSTAEVNNFLESFPNVFQPPRKTASLPVAARAAFIKYLHSSLRGYRPHAQDLRCSVPTDLSLFRYGIFVSLRRGSVTPPRTRARQAPSGACPFLLKKNLNAIVTRRISRTLPFLSSLLRLPSRFLCFRNLLLCWHRNRSAGCLVCPLFACLPPPPLPACLPPFSPSHPAIALFYHFLSFPRVFS